MNNERRNFMLLLALVAVFAVVAALFVPVQTKAPRSMPPGAPTALRAVFVASYGYVGNHAATRPSSLNDLVGVHVLDSDGRSIQFTKGFLLRELGTNATALAFFPELNRGLHG
jgi:hypothetical protein